MQLDPIKRFSTKKALNHEFFKNAPECAKKGEFIYFSYLFIRLDHYPESHQWTVRKRKRALQAELKGNK